MTTEVPGLKNVLAKQEVTSENVCRNNHVKGKYVGNETVCHATQFLRFSTQILNISVTISAHVMNQNFFLTFLQSLCVWQHGHTPAASAECLKLFTKPRQSCTDIYVSFLHNNRLYTSKARPFNLDWVILAVRG